MPDDKYKYKKVEYIKPSTNGKKDDKPKKILPKRIAQQSEITKEEPKWIGKPTKKAGETEKKSPLDEALDLLGIKGEYTKSLKGLVQPEEYAKQYKDPNFLKEQIGNLFSWKPIEETVEHLNTVWNRAGIDFTKKNPLEQITKKGFDLETNRDLFSAVVTTAFAPISTAFQYIENIPFVGQQSTDYAMRNLNMVGAVVENVVPNVKFSDNPEKQKEWENFFIETVPILVAMTEGKLIKDKISIEKNPEKLLPALEEVIENAQFDKVDGKVKILTGTDAVKKEIKVKKEKVQEKKTKANTIEEYKEALSEEKNLINLGETLKLEQLEIKKKEKIDALQKGEVEKERLPEQRKSEEKTGEDKGLQEGKEVKPLQEKDITEVPREEVKPFIMEYEGKEYNSTIEKDRKYLTSEFKKLKEQVFTKSDTKRKRIPEGVEEKFENLKKQSKEYREYVTKQETNIRKLESESKLKVYGLKEGDKAEVVVWENSITGEKGTDLITVGIDRDGSILLKDESGINLLTTTGLLKSISKNKSEGSFPTKEGLLESISEKVKESEPVVKPEGKVSKIEQVKVEKEPIKEVLFKEEESLPRVTSIKNEIVNKEREQRGLEKLENKYIEHTEEVIKRAEEEVAKGFNPTEFAREIIKDPKPLETWQGQALLLEKAKLENRSELLTEQINKSKGEEKIQLEAGRLKIDELVSENEKATVLAGTEQGRAFRHRQELINRRDYKRVSIIREAKSILEQNKKRKELTKEEITFYETQTRQIKELTDRVNELEEGKLLTKAQDVINKIKEEDIVDIDVKIKELEQEWASSTKLQALVDPRHIELSFKLMKLYKQKGIKDAGQLADKIYNIAKDNIKEVTKRDILETLAEFKEETKLKETKAKLEKLEGQPETSKLKALKTRYKNDIKRFEAQIEKGEFERQKRHKVVLDKEAEKLKDLRHRKKLEVDRGLMKLDLENRTPEQKLGEGFIDVMNLTRSAMACADMSGMLRQSAIMTVAHPLKSIPAFKKQFGYFFSDNKLARLQREISESKNAVLHDKSKLFLATKEGEFKISKREETFMSKLAERIPLMGQVVKASNRAFIGYLDKLRIDLFDAKAEQFKQSGWTFEKNPEVYKDLASLINMGTGRGHFRGKIGIGFDQIAPMLSVGIFSPRLNIARLQMLNPYYYAKLSKPVRKMALKDMGKFVGVNLALLAFINYAFPGVSTELDPRSTDFMKLKVGNTRVDLWGGHQQFITFFTRLVLGEIKTQNGDIVKISKDKFPFTTRKDLIYRFAEQKMSPSFGFIRDMLTGKTFMGENIEFPGEDLKEPKIPLWERGLELITPLYPRDLLEAYMEGGFNNALLALPGWFGTGVQTYKPREKAPKKKVSVINESLKEFGILKSDSTPYSFQTKQIFGKDSSLNVRNALRLIKLQKNKVAKDEFGNARRENGKVMRYNQDLNLELIKQKLDSLKLELIK